MSYFGLLTSFTRLSVNGGSLGTIRNISTNLNPLFFKSTDILHAEPLKKKKKIDPAILKQREDKRKKRLEKQIRRLQKVAMQLKPIEECEVSFKLIDEKTQRLRKLPQIAEEKVEERDLLQKAWCNYKYQQHLSTIQMIDRVLASQQKALDQLKMESEELYFEAIQPDLSLVPYSSEGPVSTPPIENYPSPDGDYQDISKTWN